MLRQRPRTDRTLGQARRAALVAALDELPTASRIYLTRRLRNTT